MRRMECSSQRDRAILTTCEPMFMCRQHGFRFRPVSAAQGADVSSRRFPPRCPCMPTHILPIAILLVLVVAPMAYAVLGWARTRGQRALAVRPLPALTWRMSLASMLLYVLAFNLVFFVQELFLVLPKALVPGLRPTLFHNNHSWSGTHPLAELFQGTGVLATLLFGTACGWRLRRSASGSAWWRLLLFWLAFGGVFMALPQLVAGAVLPQGDAGRAMTYLGMGEGARTVVALIALVAIPLYALWLLKPLLE